MSQRKKQDKSEKKQLSFLALLLVITKSICYNIHSQLFAYDKKQKAHSGKVYHEISL